MCLCCCVFVSFLFLAFICFYIVSDVSTGNGGLCLRSSFLLLEHFLSYSMIFRKVLFDEGHPTWSLGGLCFEFF